LLEGFMAIAEQRTETGASLMFIGFALWVAGLLVVFFLPGGIKTGHEAALLSVIGVLAGCGSACVVSGYKVRGRRGEEE
jgi:energy-converting hydrogenase Eha subunit G